MWQVVLCNRGCIVDHIDTFPSLIDAQTYASMRNMANDAYHHGQKLTFNVWNPAGRFFDC